MAIKGSKQTPEHIAKRVASVRKAKEAWTEERYRLFCQRLSDAHKGYAMPEERKQKQSQAMKGKRNSLGTVRSEKFRRKLSEYWTDNPNHNHFVDGNGDSKSNNRQKTMARIDYRLWREAVFKRDNYTCINCGKVGGQLEAHHVKSYTDFPGLRFKVDNGQTLCVKCHSQTDNYKGRGRRNKCS